ncbi:MAG TPA: DNA-3-methyladenine glycosylase I [Chthoniobacterales bacterium]
MSARCPWCEGDADYVRYHDEEWGVPSHDDRHLFEMLILEGAQAGLSWLTILRKRAHYRRVFHDFDAARVARFTEEEVAAALLDPGIVRNRLKVRATVLNARGTLAIRGEFGSFDAYLWRFVNGRPIQGNLRSMADGATRTPESDALSKDLLRRGFKFVGTTICHAYMQAVGLRNDHLVTCPSWKSLSR